MSKIDRLLHSYSRFIAVPWRYDTAAAQRVVFCVYDKQDELRLRARIDEFEMQTRQAEHDWVIFDLTNTFADWLCRQRYARSYFQKPSLLPTLLNNYLDYITEAFDRLLRDHAAHEGMVVALKGVGTLFGFLKVKEAVDHLAPRVSGKLLIFFPGSYEKNNYRLLDGYDGWNYLAVPITADKDI